MYNSIDENKNKSNSGNILNILMNYPENWKFFPCKNKMPLTKNGFKDASRNPDQLIQWNKFMPDCQWGLPTGQATNLFILDVDDEEALLKLTALYGDLPETCCVQTSRGKQYYFNYDGELTIGSNFRPGLDFRGEGGYVICPPSIHHESGNPYKFINGTEFFADAPQWLITLIKEKKVKHHEKQEYQRTNQDLDDKQWQAREWLKHQSGAIQGKGADGYASALAVSLLWDFDLTPDEAFEIFMEWGQKESNKNDMGNFYPWKADEIYRKLDWADGRPTAKNNHRGNKIRTRMPDVSDFFKKNKQTQRKGNNMKTLEEIFAMPDPTFIADDHLPTKAFGIVCGQPTAFKSFWALDLGLSIATGKSFLNKYPTKIGKVLYMAGEGEGGYKRRALAWIKEKNNGIIPKNFLMRGGRLDLCCPQFLGVRTVLGELLQANFNDPSLIIIDTKARYFTGNENDGEAQGLFVAGVDDIIEKTGATVLVVDHTPKYNDKITRGHSSIIGAADVIFNLVRGEDKSHLVEVNNTKMKDTEETETYTLTAKKIEVFPNNPNPKLRTSLILLPSQNKVISKDEIDKLRIAAYYFNCETGRSISDAYEIWNNKFKQSLPTFKRLTTTLINEKMIVLTKDGGGSRAALYKINIL